MALVDHACQLRFADGRRLRLDTLYPVLGAEAQSQLAATLGARLDDEGALVVDAHLETSVPGLYAIGDVVSALNQISVAVGHAAIAATAVHRRLPPNYC
jgi:thioredoxin reductase (NADPH)